MTNWVNNIARKFILLATMLLIGYCYANAQNSPAAPYIGSTQLYRVPMGDFNNDVKWHLQNPNFNSSAELELQTTMTWISFGKFERVTPQRDSAYIQVTFDPAIFEDSEGTIIADPWQLIYSEFSGDECVARRVVKIAPKENEFNLTVLAYASDCNPYTGLTWTNNDTIYKADTMVVSLSVVMEKDPLHRVREWSCNGLVSVSTGFVLPAALNVFIPVTNRTGASTSGGVFTISSVTAGSFTLTINNLDPDDLNYDADGDVVTFDIQIIGPPTSDVEVTLAISNGLGVSGNNFRVVTSENNSDDNAATRLLFGIPNTSIVAASP